MGEAVVCCCSVGDNGLGDGAEGPAASASLFAVFAGQGVHRGCRSDREKLEERVERDVGSCSRPLFTSVGTDLATIGTGGLTCL